MKPKFKVGDIIIIPPETHQTEEQNVTAIIDKINFQKSMYVYTFIKHWSKDDIGQQNEFSIRIIDEDCHMMRNYNKIWNELNANAETKAS